MSEDPTIVTPTFDTSSGSEVIDLAGIDDDATVEPIHSFPAPVVPAPDADSYSASGAAVEDVPAIADPPPMVVPPDIARVGDDPLPSPPENLADPMM